MPHKPRRETPIERIYREVTGNKMPAVVKCILLPKPKTERPLGELITLADEWFKTLADGRRVKFTNQEHEITFAGSNGVDVTAISLWENKTDADAYNTNTYPQVLKTMARFIEGTPQVQTSNVVNSTFHKIAVAVAA